MPIRERRNALRQDDLYQAVYEGTMRARKVAQETMNEVRKVISTDYFS